MLDRAAEMLDAGDTEEALRLLDLAEPLVSQVGSVEAAASVHKLRGDALSDRAEFIPALAEYVVAQSLFEQLGSATMLAVLAMEIGIVQHNLGRPRTAIGWYREAEETFLANLRETELDFARLQQNLGVALCGVGEHDEALARHEAARALFAKHRERRNVADCDVNIANVLVDLGRYAEAVDLNVRAAEEYEQLGLPAEAADCADHLGALLTIHGWYERAIPIHRQAIDTYRRHALPLDEAVAAYNLAHALFRNGDLQGAAEALEHARDVRLALDPPPSTADIDLLRASVEAARGNPAQGLQLLDRAVHELDPDDDLAQGTYETVRGEVLRLAGRPAEALAPLHAALRRLTQGHHQLALAEAAMELALTYRALGDKTEAQEHSELARRTLAELDLPQRIAEWDERIRREDAG